LAVLENDPIFASAKTVNALATIFERVKS